MRTTLAACGMALMLAACNTASGQSTPGGAQGVVAIPARARRGDTITLSGQNWRPNSQVTLAFSHTGVQDDVATDLGKATADNTGQFKFVTIVPQAAAPGEWTISARADGDQNATTSFTVLEGGTINIVATQAAVATSALTLTPTNTAQPSATPQPTARPTKTAVPPTATPVPTKSSQPVLAAVWRGDKLELTGNGWPASEQIKVSLSKDKDGKNATQLGILGTNNQGKFDTLAGVPKQLRNYSYVVAQDSSRRLVVKISKSDN